MTPPNRHLSYRNRIFFLIFSMILRLTCGSETIAYHSVKVCLDIASESLGIYPASQIRHRLTGCNKTYTRCSSLLVIALEFQRNSETEHGRFHVHSYQAESHGGNWMITPRNPGDGLKLSVKRKQRQGPLLHRLVKKKSLYEPYVIVKISIDQQTTGEQRHPVAHILWKFTVIGHYLLFLNSCMVLLGALTRR